VRSPSSPDAFRTNRWKTTDDAHRVTAAGGPGRATLTVMFGIGVSRLFGLVREQVVAFYFGRAAQYSAFVAAYKVPNLVRVLLGEGNLSASFIPVLS